MRWTEALKIYNQGKMWCVPKKGTKEHAEVLAIMRGDGGGKKIETPKATPTTPKKIRPKIEKMATKSDDINKRLKALKDLKGKISQKKRAKVVEFLRSVIQKKKDTLSVGEKILQDNVRKTDKGKESYENLKKLSKKIGEMVLSKDVSDQEIVDFWNDTLSRSLALYGAEYFSSGEMSEASDEMWNDLVRLRMAQKMK